MSGVTSYFEAVKRREQSASANFASSTSPDAIAKANALSRDMGVPADFVDRNLGAVETQFQARRASDLIREYPTIGKWGSDPRNAAMAGDDLDALKQNARYWRGKLSSEGTMTAARAPVANFRNFFSGVWTNLVEGGKSAKAGFSAIASDVIPISIPKRSGVPTLGDFGFDNAMRSYNRAQSNIDAARPDFGSGWKGKTASGLYSGVSSLAQMVPGVAVGALTGGAGGALTMAAPVGLEAYGKYRSRGASPGMAGLGASGEAGIEAVTELLPMKFLVESFGKVGFKPFVTGLLGREIPGEQLATITQDAIDTAIANPDKTWGEYLRERPDAAYETLVASLVPGVLVGGSSEVARKLHQREQAAQAETDAAFLGQLATGVQSSKVAKRDPSAFARFLELQAEGSPVESLYIPADKLTEYFQSNDMDYRSDSGFSFSSDFADQYEEAAASGGDVVIKTSDFAAHVAGTPAWDALKDHVRLSPGGVSLAEARTFAEGSDAAMEAMGEEYAAQVEQEKADREPRQKLYQSIRDKLTNAGFTQNAADTNAALVTARYATRASRKGLEIKGDEFDSVAVNQVLPEKLAPIVAADQLDIVIDAMKRARVQRSDTQKFGPSLLEWIAAQGGIEDKGGDLASMGANDWHKGKVGKRKLIRAHQQDDPSFLPSAQQNANSPDELALRAQEAGYFPVGERPSLDALRDAIDAELRGKPVYAEDRSGTTDQVREAADELAALLDQEGLDAGTASKADIRKAVERYQAEQMAGRGYDQADVKSAAFKAWFGDSKVVDAAGKPLVVYHGTNQPIDNFDTERLGNVTSSESSKHGFFFTNDPHVASLYAANAASRLVSGVVEFERKSVELKKQVDLLEKQAQRTGNWDAYEAAVVEWEDLEIGGTREEDSGQNVVPAYLSIQNPKVIDFEGETILKLNGGFGDAIAKARKEGHDGLILRNINDTPNESRVADHYVIFEPTQIKSVNNRGTFDPADPRILHQSFMDGPRGRITFPASGFGSGPSVIDLFQARDPSTFLHESAHLWLEELRFDAEQPGATDQIRADWQAVQDWFATEGHDLADGIPVDAHEMWARGVERFLMEGKSPSSALRKVFDTFRSWLLNIYQVVANLRSPISPEIRDVMERLIATDQEIAQARQDQNIKALFADAASAGMTELVFAEYQKLTQESRDEAFDALLFKTMSTIRREKTKAWKDERDAVKADVTERVNARPEFRALAMMRAKGSGIRLDRAWLVETYGEDALALLPKGVPPIYGENGTNADAIAEMLGFSTGDDLVRTLMAVGQRSIEMKEGGDLRSVRAALIEDETATVMVERHGDPLSDGSIEEEALTLIHNEKQGEVIASELRELGRRSNRQATPYALARQWAAETIAKSKVADSLSGTALQRYARAARNAAKLAEDAMLKGDVDETYRQKQRQMLNNALIAEAGKVKALIDAAVARLSKVAKRATMKSVDQEYLEQAHALLEQVDFRLRPQSQIDRQESFEAWADARRAEGHDVVVPGSFAATLGQENWSRLSVEKLLGLKDAVDQIIHLGRFKQTLIDNKERREFDEVVQEAVDSAGGLRQRPPASLAQPGFFDAIRANVESWDTALLKIETIIDWLDGGKADGVFNRIVFKPIAEAQDREADMLKEYQGKVVDAMKALPEKTLARWQEKVTVNLGGPFGGPTQRQQLVAMALNMGNAGNIQRLADGYGWSEQAIWDVLERELKAEDWVFVQQVWDIIDALWPQIEAMEKRINGIAPEKVEATPRMIGDIALRGGYYPAIYDGNLSIDAEVNAGREADLFEAVYTRANTTASATKARAQKVKRPILLQLGVINRHLGEVIHDITHREAIMQADKFLSDRRIIAAIDGSLGPEYRKMFRPWLKFIANQWAMERSGNEGLAGFFAKMRTNTTVVGMGFRISTILTQLAGYSNSFEYVGAKWVTAAIAKTAAHPVASFNFVMERSGEVRNRMDTIDRDIREGIGRLAGKAGFVSEAKRFAFHGIGLADRVVVIPTWIGAYNKAIASGVTEEAAIYEGDKAVRKSQGASAAKDMAAVQRGTGKSGELLKYATMFYSYMSAQYQRQRTLGRDVRGGGARDVPELVSRFMWLVMVPPVLAGILSGSGPDDDEDWAAWAFKQSLFNALGPIPVVRDLARPIWDKVAGNPSFGYALSPVQRAGQTLIEAIDDVADVLSGEDTQKATRNIMETIGYATGLIPGQIAQSTQFIVDVAYGEQEPDGVSEWIEGLTKGKIRED